MAAQGSSRMSIWPVWNREAGLRLMLMLLPLAVYFNGLHNPFHYDDFHSIVDNPHLRDLTNIPTFFVDPSLFSAVPELAMYRPLLLVTYALNYALSGTEVWSYHLLTLLFHLTCVQLVYAIAKRLLGGRPAALLAALIFALHPVNSEAINYISSRSEVLAALFMLSGFYCFLAQSNRPQRALGVGSAYVAGLASKSIAIGLPVLLALYELLFEPRSRDKKLYLLLAGMALVYLSWMAGFIREAGLETPVRSYGEQWWSQVKAIIFYLKLLCWPVGLSVDHQFLLSDSLFDPFAASAFFAFAALVGLAFVHRRRQPLPLFLLCWVLVGLAPSSLVPLNVLVNEHRLYLPSAAFALGLGWILERLMPGFEKETTGQNGGDFESGDRLRHGHCTAQ